ncbi:MarR family winged helix-turn-helix transcriptional regulator [Candidatus Contubernalis alkaliaceticus]|uniref:MarR family winged helix-turn-helix transcriptional regulator n=1 Tax=Candidatus Contubernalis alkaliaceticus TaxID=338645 RepID=UPI001F4C3E00|nr:MarR family transcriptional regulator [Candidatus Contubernalis alkalaceticus]UNC91982.1 MarR family transcriptional regulator [Candidatus Contubernalis alkalaceticus]
MNSIENSLGFLLSKCHRKAFQMLKQRLEPYGITPPQFAVMSFLWQREGINQNQLGELMNTDNATLSGIIDRLEKVGYIKREKNLQDRRSFSLVVTEDGVKIQKELESIVMEHYKILTKPLEEDELMTLIQLLKKLKSG